jgi:chromosome segregation ATPase
MIIMAEEKNKGMDDTIQIDTLKDRLTTVSNEIDAIKMSFSKSTEDLSRIQNMLGVDNIDELGNIVEKFESRVAEAEQKRAEAIEGARRYSEELEKEKERLIKLWDAYKNQEEELSTAEKKVNEFEQITKQTEANKKQLEEDLTLRINTLTQKLEEYQEKANMFDEYRVKCEQFDNIRNQLEREIHDLKEDNKQKESVINDMNDKIKELSGKEDFSQFKEKYEEMTIEYEKEKERLTKLYQLYEETDFECKRLNKENQEWHNWYNSNKDIFGKLFSNSPPADSPTEEKSQEESNTKTKEKTKL